MTTGESPLLYVFFFARVYFGEQILTVLFAQFVYMHENSRGWAVHRGDFNGVIDNKVLGQSKETGDVERLCSVMAKLHSTAIKFGHLFCMVPR